MDNSDYVEIYIKNEFKEYKSIGLNFDNTRNYKYLYQNIKPIELSEIFGYFHSRLNYLFKSLSREKSIHGHYNADEIIFLKNLISDIENLENFQKKLSNSKFSFSIEDKYKDYMQKCKEFLTYSWMFEGLEPFELFETQPIFKIQSSISINRKNIILKPIGEGSYATVSKYKDRTYDKFFVIKKAKQNLNQKELIRFKNEFEYMKRLNSPYILEVYSFDENNQSYIMEYADMTLQKYIEQNNTKILMNQRINLIHQILEAFEYINQTVGFHRDISTTNILLKKYGNNVWVVKVADFGLVKEKNSNLTSFNTEFKGSLNDPKLDVIGGFKNYTGHHETYALTRLVYFILTGRRRIDKFKNIELEKFIENGISDKIHLRYKNVKTMRNEFQKIKIFLR